MDIPWSCNALIGGLQQACNEITTMGSGLATNLQGIYNGLKIVLQWSCKGLANGLQQVCDRLVMALPWVCNGLAIGVGQKLK